MQRTHTTERKKSVDLLSEVAAGQGDVPDPCAPLTLIVGRLRQWFYVYYMGIQIMINAKNRNQKSSLHLKFVNKSPLLSCDMRFVIIILFATLIIGCVPESTPTQIIYPTTMASCFPNSVFTADDMRARVDCHPDDYKIEINSDTVVLFAFPDPLLDWAGPIFVIHIPSVSEVVLNIDGSIFMDGYKSSDGQNAIESVLNNQELMTSILARAKEIEKSKP